MYPVSHALSAIDEIIVRSPIPDCWYIMFIEPMMKRVQPLPDTGSHLRPGAGGSSFEPKGVAATRGKAGRATLQTTPHAGESLLDAGRMAAELAPQEFLELLVFRTNSWACWVFSVEPAKLRA